ncbi:hypothetical protein ACWD62_41545 [Streptomyces sp. NPDC005146]
MIRVRIAQAIAATAIALVAPIVLGAQPVAAADAQSASAAPAPQPSDDGTNSGIWGP